MSLSFPWVLRVLRSRPVVLGAAFAAALAVLSATDGAGRPAREHPIAWHVVPEARAAYPAPATAAPTAPRHRRRPGRAQGQARGRHPGRRRQGRRRDHDRRRGVRITKPGRGSPHATVGGHEYDWFEAFVEQAPWIAGLVFMTTALVFLVPLVVIILVDPVEDAARAWMMNETMLKLAERGAVPAGEAMQAIPTAARAGARVQSGHRATLRAGKVVAPQGRLVRLAQGRDPRRDRLRYDGLLDARRRFAERARADPALRRHRFRRALVPRGPAERGTAGNADEPVGRRVTEPRPAAFAKTATGARWRRPRFRMPRLSPARSSSDDRHAFAELVRRHQSAVRACLRRLTAGHHALADDLAQETFGARMAPPRQATGRKPSSRPGCTGSRPTAGSPMRASAKELLGDATDDLAEASGTAFTGGCRGPRSRTGCDDEARPGTCGSRRSRKARGRRSCSATIMTSRTRRRLSSWACRSARSRRTSSAASRSSRRRSPPGAPAGCLTMTADRTCRTSPTTTSDDDWLDAALAVDAREHGSSYLDDRGFTARVMTALPAPVAVPRWRKPALVALESAAIGTGRHCRASRSTSAARRSACSPRNRCRCRRSRPCSRSARRGDVERGAWRCGPT